ncbi:MAG: hypothetical protein JST32_03420, partial [Bacteroidetes bacterium]|nr:hypothetical protein [Bacteroidota bacterium]
MTKIRRIYFLIAQMALFGCRKLYNPEVVSSPNNYLVVEGVINRGDTTIIRVS